MDEKIAKAIVSSPLGGLEITAENGAVTTLNWVDEEPTTPVNSLSTTTCWTPRAPEPWACCAPSTRALITAIC